MFNFNLNKFIRQHKLPYEFSHLIYTPEYNFCRENYLTKSEAITMNIPYLSINALNELYFGAERDNLKFARFWIESDDNKYVYCKLINSFTKSACKGNFLLTFLIIQALNECNAIIEKNNYSKKRINNSEVNKKLDEIESKINNNTVTEKDITDLQEISDNPYINKEILLSDNSINTIISSKMEEKLDKYKEIKPYYSNDAGKLDIGKEITYLQQLTNIICNYKFKIKNFVHYSKKYINRMSGFIMSNEIELLIGLDSPDIINHELLLYPAFINDLIVKTKVTHRKYNIYCDTSGSTSGEVLLQIKSLTMYYHKKKQINNLYLFKEQVKPTNIKSLMIKGSSGGTSINNVIYNIEDQKYPSLIITDCVDKITKYSKNTYLLVFGEYNASNFSGSGLKFIKEKKILFYNNNKFIIPNERS